jgi:hypothetical protein
MGMLLFSIDDDIDTDLDTPIWDGAFQDAVRYDALAREVDHLIARTTTDSSVVPPCIGSLVLLAGSLRRLAAGAANGTYRELFATDGFVGGFLNAAYAAARDAVVNAHDPRAPHAFDAVNVAQRRLDAVADELPDELRMPVLEAFVAFSRFRSDVA